MFCACCTRRWTSRGMCNRTIRRQPDGASLWWFEARLAPQCGDHRCDLCLTLAHGCEQASVVADRGVAVRMRMTGVALEREEDRQHAAHQRFRLAEPVGGLQQQGEVVEARRDVRMVRCRSLPRRWPARGASAARPRRAGWWPAATAARLLRSMATSGWSGPKLASSMASARRISGSASPSRLVACSNCARLLRRMATLGWSGPKLVSSMASARRISGSASAEPVGGLQQLRQVVEVDGDVGMVGAEAASRRWPARGASAARPRPSRLVACSSCARLLRPMATFGMVGAEALSRRWPARGASAARPRRAGWWPAATAPGC